MEDPTDDIQSRINELFTMIEMYERIVERIIRFSKGGKLTVKDEAKLDEAYSIIEKCEAELGELGV
jgi:ribosome-binding ATPase YchF (GTP1/OBG family)